MTHPKIIQSWEEVDQALKRLAELEILEQELQGQMTLEINQIKEHFKLQAQPHKRERRHIEGLIKDFCEAHKQEFLKKRSKTLEFGKVAWRVSKRIVIPRAKEKLAATIRAIKALGFTQCLRVKEELDRDALDKLTDQDLARLGLQRKVQDKLRIEPNIEKLKEGTE